MKLGEILVTQGLVTSVQVDEAIERQKAMADQNPWSITSDRVQWAKEELKGRRAAVEARYADELAIVDADLEELATLDRIAGAFTAKHWPKARPEDLSDEPVGGADASGEAALKTDASDEPAVELAELQPPFEEEAEEEPEPETRWAKLSTKTYSHPA
jgi:hypothetical protein